MTDVLPDRETHTTNLAVARLRAQEWPRPEPRIYNSQRLRAEDTLIMHNGEGAVLITGEAPSLAEELFGYGTAPTQPPKVPRPLPSPNPPPKPSNVRRPFFQPGARRAPGAPRPIPARWAWTLVGFGAASVVWSALGLAGLAAIA